MKNFSILAVFTIAIILLFNNCKNSEKKPSQKKETEAKQTLSCAEWIKENKINNLNISILLDLSDRIDPIKYPNPTMSYANTDLGYINTIAKSFINHARGKKVIMMHEKIQVFFDPPPADTSINNKSQKLKVFLDKNLKTSDLQNTLDNYKNIPQKVYDAAIKDGNYIGSDTWSFFKHKVKNYCIQKCNRNILVILTDGYIFHSNTKRKEGGKKSYITPQMLREIKLNKSNWKQIMDKNDYGFIPATQKLDDLEVLVLGIVNHDKVGNPYGKDVLIEYWTKWLTSMGVKRFEIHGTDLPSNMETIIQKFIKN